MKYSLKVAKLPSPLLSVNNGAADHQIEDRPAQEVDPKIPFIKMVDKLSVREAAARGG